ncbi:unnamed protein product, partial [Musa hybrid cultivar]
KLSTRKLVQSITHSPGKVFEMLHTILLIRIEPAIYIYPHTSSRCEQWASVGALQQVASPNLYKQKRTSEEHGVSR